VSTYPTYKPSGIEWLGNIPKNWISTRVKNALVFDIGGTPSRNKMEYFDGDNLWVSIADLNNQDLIIDTSEKITDEAIEDSNCKLIPKDSLLFSFKLSVGHLAFAGSNLYTNEAIAAFRPSNRLNVRFLKYLLQIEFESNANTNIYGAYLFNKETLGAAKIVFPDDSKEQTAIANYLDEKTSKLDQLISNKKAQIDKLKEIRQIEINTAVTKGLDRNVKLKPSGVEWLGDIPEHWISTRVKNALVFDIGGTPARNKMEYFDGNNLWVSISDLNNQDIINDTSEKITDEAVEDSNCKLIPKGSLLFSFKLSVGHLAFAGSDLYTNEAIAAFRPSNRLNVRFLKYLLQIEFESNANTNIYGAYLFNKETLGTAKIVFPDDSKEQTAIANYLDEKTSKIDQLVHNLENQIEQLQEVRKIEIYNAVTGKIKTG
jgi:type I restriction enzyme S subunit